MSGEISNVIDSDVIAFKPKSKDVNVNILPQLLNPIEDPQVFIDDDRYLAQEKKDGERRMIESVSNLDTNPLSINGIQGYNRKGQITSSLPETIKRSINFACDLIIDGEIISEKYYVFDILSLNGESLKNKTCVERIKILNEFNFGKGIEVVKTAYTKEEKQQMFNELKANNAEGIVFKRKDSPYTTGRPASMGNSLKYKFQKSGTFIVSNITKGKRSVGMEVLDGEKRIFVGKVSVPVNHELPEVGNLIEVQYLYAFKGGCLFHPVYKGKRSDIDVAECTINQIVYKAD